MWRHVAHLPAVSLGDAIVEQGHLLGHMLVQLIDSLEFDDDSLDNGVA